MSKRFLFIDYENVIPAAIESLNREEFNIFIFVGASQTKVTFEIASALQLFGERATYIKIAGNGPNALDFHISYYIGRLSNQHRDAHFHVLSKDAGFDPLIRHLNAIGILANRMTSVAELLSESSAAAVLAERVPIILANLVQRGASRPRTLKTLRSTINALFQKNLSAPEVDTLISELLKKGYVLVAQQKVSYSLPSPT